VLGELVAPLARLSVRGVGANFIQGELVTVVREMFPTRAVSLEELGGSGKPTLIGGDHGGDEGRMHLVEFGDGAGRRFRLGVDGPLPGEARAALSVVGMMSGLVMEVAVLRGFAEQRTDPAVAELPDPEIPGLIVASSAMRQLGAELVRLGSSRATVIITGESGVGKDVIARALHGLSTRAGKPFMALNCAAVPRELFEAQLFGHRRGAFTGAASDSSGVVRAAAGGTLFLDEVGELPLDIQPKILRFLENGEVLPLGEQTVQKVDVRLVAATNRDLAQLVRDGRFRQDLYYRLQVVPIHVPPLRERREDIVALARHFVRSLTPDGKEPPVLAPDALVTLATHDWPGNVRELRNVVERALAFAPFPRVLTAQHLRFV
jgi:transcriptional regulator with GAF, ATPase, and Fis domain